MSARYYHRTDAAEAILRDGFRDGSGSYGLATVTLTGVFLSDQPLGVNEGATGEQLLEVTLDADLAPYEIHDEVGGCREWCVPAVIVNTGQARVLTEREADQAVRFAQSVRRVVDSAPPLTPEQLERLAFLLRPPQ